jgi:glyoxylase-like metal-dependent hydrolase (beta-lactamase superfamily II)
MIRAHDYGEVRFFPMGKSFAGRVFYWTGIYWLDGLILDSGPSNLACEVKRLFAELKIDRAVVTHAHEDHCGNNRLLKEELGVETVAPEKSLPLLAKPVDNLELYRRILWGTPPPFEAKPLAEVLETNKYRFQIIPTPGHSDDHVVLFETEHGWLFTGDLYLAPTLRVLRVDENIHALIDSLRKVMDLEPEVLFCQHRGRVDDAREMLRQKYQHLVEIRDRIEELHRQGFSEKETAARLPGGDLLWRIGTAGHFSKLNFVRSWLRNNA